ncbi:MAG: hypothetical protein LQ342_001930 [Letrouitia transgressa]|nr:MAG: hypothetical protein LQ342_001930 [Letrouitia transgressa]
MASEPPMKAVNGTYAGQPAYVADQQSHPQATSSSTSNAPAGSFGPDTANMSNAANNASTGGSEASSSVSKDEVGWYFVEQYYTTLSKNPEKLHLFYSKRSQFVSGVEAEKVSVSVGQRAINERIKELDIQDCKVRVSNVDSQASFKNIVVQVIGEMSNKAAPHRKFVQTFVLAEQPNGYFVLNDIFRYINDEDEEELEQPDSTADDGTTNEDTVGTLAESNDPDLQQHAVEELDKKLNSEAQADVQAADDVSGRLAEEEKPERTTNKPADSEAEEAFADQINPINESSNAASEEAVERSAAQEAIQTEKPRDPEPTPVSSPPKPANATPVQAPVPSAPPKPAAPKTWANLVAANRVAAPAVSSPANSIAATSQPKTASPSTNQPSVNSPSPIGDDLQSQAQQNTNAGWQTAGTDNGRRQGRGLSVSGNNEKETVLGYVKNVTDKVDASILKNTLTQYGKLAYFDNCAFVEFETIAGYNAAVAANPHLIGGEQIYVEERRPRPTAYGGFNTRGGMRGGRGGTDGRTNGQGRGNFPKDGGRGGFVPRGRGGSMTPRGRGQAQAV